MARPGCGTLTASIPEQAHEVDLGDTAGFIPGLESTHHNSVAVVPLPVEEAGADEARRLDGHVTGVEDLGHHFAVRSLPNHAAQEPPLESQAQANGLLVDSDWVEGGQRRL